jgi:hypothetical protein
MLSGSVLGPSGEGPRRRHPVATGVIVILMMAVLFGATFGAVRLLKGSSDATPSASASSPAPCVTATVRPGVVLPKPGKVTTNVYNATNRAGLARTTAATLSVRGFKIGTIANDPLGKALANVGEIRYGPSGKDNAALMRYYVPGAVLVLDQRADPSIDVVLGLKFKAVPDQKIVTAALAKPVVVTTGAGCPSPSTAAPTTAKPAASPKPSPATS